MYVCKVCAWVNVCVFGMFEVCVCVHVKCAHVWGVVCGVWSVLGVELRDIIITNCRQQSLMSQQIHEWHYLRMEFSVQLWIHTQSYPLRALSSGSPKMDGRKYHKNAEKGQKFTPDVYRNPRRGYIRR